MTKSNQIPSLDGIRAVAFGLVLVGHSMLVPFIPAGLGVTVFFFLSGYLITTLLLREVEATSTVSIQRFYLRRALRILPPLGAALLIFAGLSFAGLIGGEYSLVGLLSQVFFFFNYYYIASAPWEGTPIGTAVLWSLAVEEHFYLLYPWVFAGRYASRLERIRTALPIVILGVLVWRCVLVLVFGASENRVAYGTDTRIDSMLFGCWLAFSMGPWQRECWPWIHRHRIAVTVGSLLLLAASTAPRSLAYRETLRYSLQGIAFIPLFYLAITEWKRPPYVWLNGRAISFIGVLSYSLYLVHHVVQLAWLNAFAEVPPAAAIVASWICTMLIAFGIRKYIEQPLIKYRARLRTAEPTSVHAADVSLL